MYQITCIGPYVPTIETIAALEIKGDTSSIVSTSSPLGLGALKITPASELENMTSQLVTYINDKPTHYVPVITR